ncbi:MAG: tyrosine-type recombinase/integrase, partial [Actinomycetes bacterium]
MSINRRTTRKGVRYDVRLRDPSGRVYTRTFRTRREAETFEARERADRSRSAWIDPRRSDITFGAWAAEWLASDPGKRQSSLARDESIVRNHLLATLGGRRLAQITPRDVQALVNLWSKTRAPRTVRRQYDTLRAIFGAAVDADRLVRSPCRGIKLPAPGSAERHVVTVDELATLAEEVGPDWRPMVYLGAVLGLRWGECAGLRVGRIDFLNRTLTVAEQRSRGAGGAMVSGPPKSEAGNRTMTVPVPLMEMLAEHLARRELTAADAGAWVFVGHDGRPLDYSNWRQRVWLPA